MREGEYEYIHEFKERINEILFLQKKHHQIIDTNELNPQIQQTSLAELHRLSITLSNLYDVAPTIIGVGKDATISSTSETKREHNNNRNHRLTCLSSRVFLFGSGTKRSTGNKSGN